MRREIQCEPCSEQTWLHEMNGTDACARMVNGAAKAPMRCDLCNKPIDIGSECVAVSIWDSEEPEPPAWEVQHIDAPAPVWLIGFGPRGQQGHVLIPAWGKDVATGLCARWGLPLMTEPMLVSREVRDRIPGRFLSCVLEDHELLELVRIVGSPQAAWRA
jgi:hypothetical protein